MTVTVIIVIYTDSRQAHIIISDRGKLRIH
jgi:hypothetical protein